MDLLFYLIIFGIYFAALITPLALIYRRLGRSGWWAALAIVPLGKVFLLWGLVLFGRSSDKEYQRLQP